MFSLCLSFHTHTGPCTREYSKNSSECRHMHRSNVEINLHTLNNSFKSLVRLTFTAEKKENFTFFFLLPKKQKKKTLEKMNENRGYEQ